MDGARVRPDSVREGHSVRPRCWEAGPCVVSWRPSPVSECQTMEEEADEIQSD